MKPPSTYLTDDVFMVVNVATEVFWVETRCNIVGAYPRLKVNYRLYLQFNPPKRP
jgi:hypothetical protein